MLDETLDLFRLQYRQMPIERFGFMVLACVYARLNDAAAGKLIVQAGEIMRRTTRRSQGAFCCQLCHQTAAGRRLSDKMRSCAGRFLPRLCCTRWPGWLSGE